MVLVTMPSPAQLYELITAGAVYQYMYFADNSNVWNNPRAADDHNAPANKAIPEGRTSFYETLKFGKAKGLLEIFDGFELSDYTLSAMS
jgi:hypothetical protein